MQTKLIGSLFLLIVTLSFSLVAQGPYYQWVNHHGSKNLEISASMKVDPSGNIILVGNFSDTVDFDSDTSIVNLISNGITDIFIQKLTPEGKLIWAKTIGGSGNDRALCVTTDETGNVFISGIFKDTVDFDPGPAVFKLSSGQTYDQSFTLKLDSNGNFVWAKSIGGMGSVGQNSVVTDASGNVYSTGFFYNTLDFDPNSSVMNLTSAGFEDIFIQKLDLNGNLVWVKQIGGTGTDEGSFLTVDHLGNIYITGTFQKTIDFNPGSGVYNLGSAVALNRHGFLLKLDSLGNFIWAQQMTSDCWVEPNSLTTDASGNIYSVGSFRGTCDFAPGTGNGNLTTGSYSSTVTIYYPDDIYVQKLNSSGNLQWIKQMGGTGHDVGNSIDLDGSGNVYISGSFGSYGPTSDFDPGPGVLNLTSTGAVDGFLQKLDQNGNLVWVKQQAATGPLSTRCVSLDIKENIYIAGDFGDTARLYSSSGQIDISSAGGGDIFIQKLNQCNSYSTDVHTACGSYTWIDSITYTESNNFATYILPNAGGCDSVITLNLTILENRVTDTYTVCDSLIWIDGNTYLSSNDSATFKLSNIHGCDSLVTLDLTVLPSSESTYSFSVCDSFTWIDGNTYTSSNNTATFVTANAAGCDSIITLNLTIEAVSDISTRIYGSTISANNKTGTYQWLDCNNHFDPLLGETDSSFTATQNGSYAVQITENGCVDTSACVTLASVGVDNLSIDNSRVLYPNPTSGKLNIELGDKIDQVEVTITDVTGAIISNTDFTNTFNIETEITGPVGVYFVIISSSEGIQTFKVVKE